MEAFFSALKRKQLKDVASEALTLLGHTEAAEELKGTSRLTVAVVDRAIKLIDAKPIVDSEDDITEELGTEDTTYFDIAQAIEDGKGKEALKLIKQAKKDGHSGQVLKDLKKQAKEL